MLDQRLLPIEEKIIVHTRYQEVAQSIEDMVIRGAPAIGLAAAMGVLLGVITGEAATEAGFQRILDTMAGTRPTAVNLFWALKRMEAIYRNHGANPQELERKMRDEVKTIQLEDVQINRRMGENGQALLESDQTVLTHCNAGALATGGFGTALGVIRSAIENGKRIRVIAGETRPFLQGARLTTWELQADGIPVTLITDNAAGFLMARGSVDAVIVGADRIARNGDTANKIGTYSLAVLAGYHHIPFYVAAPTSTIDFDIQTGADIPIEERSRDEVINFRDQRIASPRTEVKNPAFDITPARLIAAIVTEEGILRGDLKRELGLLEKKLR
jgi:methylthioribose-1-phosphate isomerase